MVSFVGLALGVDDFPEFLEEGGEVLGDEVGADGVLLGEVVGGLPLVDVELAVSVVQGRVVGVGSLPHLQVSKADASRQSSEVISGDLELGQQGKGLGGLLVAEREYLLLLDAGVVGAVGHWPRVVEGVKSCVHQ